MNARATFAACAAACTSGCLPGPAAGQADAAGPGQRVEITGSLLPRAASETALPLHVLTAEDLAKAGAKTLEDALQLVAQNQTWVGSSWSVTTTGAASVADLRGLGSSLTLVLVNGQRIVTEPYREFGVNLNMLPTAAIERIEVLTGSASAMYGSDAIAGVVNVITRREYPGGRLGVSVRVPQAAGGDQYHVNLIGGHGSLATQGYSIYAGVDATRERRIRTVDRDYARAYQPERGYDATSTVTFPGNYSQRPGVVSTNPALPGCRPPGSVYIAARSTDACRHDTTNEEDLTPEIERWSLLTRGTLALGGEHTVSVEYFRGYNRMTVRHESTPLEQMDMTPASPFFPGGAAGVPITDPALDPLRPISVAWRAVEAGPRTRHEVGVTQRLLAESAGRHGGWHYRATVQASRTESDLVFQSGFLDRSRVVNGVLGVGGAPFLNPFGPQTPTGLAWLEASQISGHMQRAKGELRGIDGTVSGDLVSLPAGPLSLAIGAEVREQRLEFRNDFSRTRLQGSLLQLAEDTSGRIRSRAVFGELKIPLVRDAPAARSLEATLAVRHDRYEEIGDAATPQVALRWQVGRPLLLRASRAHGFAVPPITLLYGTSQLTRTIARNDPLLCPAGVPVAGADPVRDCNARFNLLTGANPELKPQHSRSWSAGFVVDVARQASLSVDYFDYRIGGYFGTIPVADAFNDPVTFAAQFVRCSQLAPDRAATFGCAPAPATVDPIAYIDRRFVNIAAAFNRGIDVAFNARGEVDGFGQVKLAWSGTYWKNNALQRLPSTVPVEFAGAYASGIGSPRWQYVAQLGWEGGPWSVRFVNRFKSGYRDSNQSTLDPAVFGNHRVRSWSVFDATLTFTGVAGLTLTAGLLNAFDKDPPFSNQLDTVQGGYDPRVASPLGRALFLEAAYRWR